MPTIEELIELVLADAMFVRQPKMYKDEIRAIIRGALDGVDLSGGLPKWLIYRAMDAARWCRDAANRADQIIQGALIVPIVW